MSVHTFVSITTTVAYICHELTITLPAFAHTILMTRSVLFYQKKLKPQNAGDGFQFINRG